MDQITITLLILTFTIVMFITEKLPLAVTAMITTMALVFFKVLDVSQAFAGFVDKNVIIFVSMVIVGSALFETGMANEIGGLITKYANTEKQVMILLMIVSGGLSGFLSNTGTTAIFIPIVMGIVAKSGYSKSKLLMLLAFSTSMGGSLSLIGTPVNLIGQTTLESVVGEGNGFSFFEYGKIGLPIMLCGILYYTTIGERFLPDSKGNSSEFKVEDRDFSDVPKWKKYTSVIVLALTILAMIFEEEVGVSIAISSCVGAIFLVAIGVISEKQAYNAIDMRTVFVFAGSLALAKALDVSGTGIYIAEKVIGIIGDTSAYEIIGTIFLLAVVITNFMSNMATAALLAPISVSIAQGIGADPKAVIMATCIGAAAAYATPIGTPSNIMVIGLGGYKFNDYVKAGLPMIIISFVVSMITLPIFFPFYPA